MTVTAPKSICAFSLAAALSVCAPVCAWAANGSYAVPPSPYGQVGNPFLTPVQVSAPQTVVTQPAPIEPRPAAPKLVAPRPAAPKPQPVRVATPELTPAPAPAAVATAAPDTGYQVPATSKYAARINAARAAAGPVATAANAQPAAATAPVADHVFVPGEHYTDVSQEPRQYSLHRQWGLTPDKITTDHTATGALLTLTEVPGSGSPAKDDTPEDDGAEAPNTAKTATP